MAATSNGTTAPKPVRCAIYTRKSTEEGLNQEFNSLDAQREAAEAYILSQKHDGSTLVPTQYSDGGYTGALCYVAQSPYADAPEFEGYQVRIPRVG
jgi:site-specific DNA recombinase